MRYLFMGVLFFAIACSPETMPSEQYAMHNMETADKVILNTSNDNSEDQFQNIMQYLKEQGFRPHFVNHKTYNIQTAYKPLSDIDTDGNSYLRIIASIENDGEILFIGKVNSENIKEKLIQKNEELPVLQKAWEKLITVAEGYPHGKVNIAP